MSCVKVHLRQRHIIDAEIQIWELQDKTKLIQHCKFYTGIPLIIIDNEHIKEGIGNRIKGVLYFCASKEKL